MLTVTITVNGRETVDLAHALEYVLKAVEGGYRSGGDVNGSGSYQFDVEGEEWDLPEEYEEVLDRLSPSAWEQIEKLACWRKFQAEHRIDPAADSTCRGGTTVEQFQTHVEAAVAAWTAADQIELTRLDARVRKVLLRLGVATYTALSRKLPFEVRGKGCGGATYAKLKHLLASRGLKFLGTDNEDRDHGRAAAPGGRRRRNAR